MPTPDNELHEREAYYRMLAETTLDAIITVNAAGSVLYANPAAERIFGYSPDELLGQEVTRLLPERLRRRQRALLVHNLTTDQRHMPSNRSELKGQHKDGREIPLEISLVQFVMQGQITLTGIVRDISDRKLAQLELRRSEERYRDLYHESPAMHFTLDIDGVILSINRFGAHALGYSVNELLGRSALQLVHENYRAAARRKCITCIHMESEVTQWEMRKVRKDGSMLWASESIRVVHAADNSRLFHVICEDITERKQAEEYRAQLALEQSARQRAEENELRLSRLANYDSLTELPNRVLFYDRLDQAIARAARQTTWVAVLFIDLDRLKHVNDRLGHGIGDLLLKSIADRLLACVRATDTVARISGDEFAVIIDHIACAADVDPIVRKIQAILPRPITLEDHQLSITASIGISFYPGDGAAPEILLKNADTAMYRAKDQGRNRHQHYASAMGIRYSRQITLEKDLERALAQQELLLHYQPKQNLATSQITGVEALLRWRHPELGMLAPLQFLPLAEATGLIETIGVWVLRTACAQIKYWQTLESPLLSMAVNISERQFGQKNLPKVIAQIASDAGLGPDHLELELTESIMQNTAAAGILRNLKASGISITLDDFGTGYSSFKSLQRLPSDTLKIDKSFIRGVPGKSDNAAITQAIIKLARSLKLKVVAEGVETAAQVKYLRSVECDEIQGYFFKRPMPADELTKLLVQRAILAEGS